MSRTTRSALVVAVSVSVLLLLLLIVVVAVFLTRTTAPDPAAAPKVALTTAPTRDEPVIAPAPAPAPAPATAMAMAAPTTPTPPTTQAAPPVVVVPPNEDGRALLPQVTAMPPTPATTATSASPATPAAVAKDAATYVAFAPGGRLLVARAGGRLEFIDLATGQRQPIDMKLPRPAAAPPRAVAMSPTGERIAVAHADGVDVWHVTSSTQTRLAAAGTDVTALAFTRGGQLVTGHAGGALVDLTGGEVKVWEAPSWTNVTTLRPGVGAVTKVAQSPVTGHVAAIGVGGGGVAVCDPRDRQFNRRLGGDQAWTSIAFAPDGHTLAAAGPGGVAMWDTIQWQKRAAPGGSEPATHVVFWRGGNVLVTAGAVGDIRVHDLATRRLMTSLSGGGGKTPIVSMDLAADDRTIAASSANAVVIWDSHARTSRRLN